MLTVIPSSGFYETLHDQAIDDAVDGLFQDDNGNPNDTLSQKVRDACDFSKVYTEYAKTYTEAFADEFKIKLEFESLSFPKEYNFETNRIYANISRAEVRRIYKAVDKDALKATAKEMFTSYAGFFSFYSPDSDSWGSVDKWDHNQVLCLLAAFIGEFDQYAEYDLMESHRGNGKFDTWICDATPDIDEIYEEFNEENQE